MTPARLQTIEEIFHAALDRPPEEIGSFLDATCQGDAILRAELESLLASHQEAGHFIETPAVDLAAKILEQGQPELLIGQRIGHYELLRRIGAGGMGEVYLAMDVTAGRKAALKLLPARFTGDTQRLERFVREAHAVVALNHPNILTIYEIGEDRSIHYIASELIDGETLRQHLERGPMKTEEALDVASQVASALVAAHEAGIVHRDIKPENIMLRPDGYVKVLDFGIAKLAAAEVPSAISDEDTVPLGETHVGSIFGTARYMSPEQVRGEGVDKRSDIWSLGAVLYEMVAGRVPFSGASAGEVMTLILEAEPPPLTNQVEPIIRRTLCKVSGERYQSARELLEALKGVHRRMDLSAESEKLAATPLRKHGIRSPAAVVLAILVALLALAFPFYWQRNKTIPAPEKSIAVLPFENLSENNEHSAFGAGIQDDLLTSLAQIHDLKVISRTSVMAYQKSDGRNIREIGRALGVANVLEGSVRRAGNRVLVNVQLIDARNDRHLWAERYDRTVADSIGLQGELASQIAVALQATLAPEEKARLAVEPTTNAEAYVLYLRALGKENKDKSAAEQLYVQAAAIDPKFALAYARASLLNSRIASYDQNRAGKAKARAQADEALRLAPNLGEAHMALGLCLYWGEKKFDAALKEFEVAAATSPNNAETYTYIGGIYRRQGRWREAVASFERALSLDPRNARIVFRAALNHLFMRDWPAASAGYRRALEIMPDDLDSRLGLAYLEVVQKNHLAASRTILQSIPPAIDPDDKRISARWDVALLERDYTGAEKILVDSGVDKLAGDPMTFYRGRTAFARGDATLAQRYFAAAAPVFGGRVRDDPADPIHHEGLGLLYAYMQKKEAALREARRAVELVPESQDGFHGAVAASNLALIDALVGEHAQAITLIEGLLAIPGPVQGFPTPLRSNPRFQKILAGPEPKTSLTTMASVAPEKSIAVLPFENLSDDQQNTYFAAGVQEEILSDLSQVADLKVTSRNSTRFYEAGQPRNSREIGRQLGVAHLLEGSVQQTGNRLRIHAQLIDARTDSHLWAQTYDRETADLFALQSEIAQTIADQLHAQISAGERAAISQSRTTDLAAADLYQRALAMEYGPEQDRALREGIALLEKAVARDPQFVQAYCAMSRMHLTLYFGGYDPTLARREAAHRALERAVKIQPDAGEVHLAAARYWYHGFRDYDRARAELELARRALPNDPNVYYESAIIDRRQGRWSEAIRNFERAVELDPRNVPFLLETSTTYAALHRYAEAEKISARALAILPADRLIRLIRADQVMAERADLRPLRRELDAILAANPEAAPEVADLLFSCALRERDPAATERALAAIPSAGTSLGGDNFICPREWFVGKAARTFGDGTGARAAFTAAREILAKQLREQPEYAAAWSLLGCVDAALGQKEEAIREGRRACELLPLAQDAPLGRRYQRDLAKIYAWAGEKELALTQAAEVAKAPTIFTYGELRLDPDWAPLRGDPRFEKIVASLAPKAP